MANRRVLFQWIGHSDLRARAGSLSQTRQKKILSGIRLELGRGGDLRPTKTLPQQVRLRSAQLASGLWMVPVPVPAASGTAALPDLRGVLFGDRFAWITDTRDVNTIEIAFRYLPGTMAWKVSLKNFPSYQPLVPAPETSRSLGWDSIVRRRVGMLMSSGVQRSSIPATAMRPRVSFRARWYLINVLQSPLNSVR